MRYRTLGRSGLRVSELCLGSMSFGEVWGFGADEAVSRSVIDLFAEAGGNFIDTANKYHEGRTEEIVGSAIASDRDRWVIATKYTLAMRDGDPNAAGNSRKNLRRAVEESLERLGTDHIDLLWVHAWDYVTPVEEVMRALDDLVSAGSVLYVGLSDSPAWVGAQANTLASLRGWSPFVALQFQYSLIERSAERELLPSAEALGLASSVFAPLGVGVLTGKYTRSSSEPVDSKRAAAAKAHLSDQALSIAREVDRVADELGATSAQVALAWTRARWEQVVPIVGIRTVEQIKDVLSGIGLELTDGHRARLDQVSAIDLGFPHSLLASPDGRAVYGDLVDDIDIPWWAPIRQGPAATRMAGG